jgi:hypothetical protein
VRFRRLAATDYVCGLFVRPRYGLGDFDNLPTLAWLGLVPDLKYVLILGRPREQGGYGGSQRRSNALKGFLSVASDATFEHREIAWSHIVQELGELLDSHLAMLSPLANESPAIPWCLGHSSIVQVHGSTLHNPRVKKIRKNHLR